MAKWSREKVNSENINGGNQYEKKDRVTLEQLNAMVNSGLYSQDFAEHLADAPDISQANTVGSAKVEVVDNVVGGKTYKKFKFSNLKGEKGDKGDKGDKGNTGETPVITATATTLSAGSSATVTKSGTAENPTLAFGIPKGDKGDKGDTGASAGFGTPTATIDSNVGTPSVTVTASGSDTSKVFNFAFKNLKGEKGDTGNTGATGATPNISVTATTLSAGSSATATISGSAESPTITFGIPKGDRGESGLIYQSTGQNTDGAMSQKATTDELTSITNALANKFTIYPLGKYDLNECYDEGIYPVSVATNYPSVYSKGVLVSFPNTATGNNKPSGGQLYFTTEVSNKLYYRTAINDTWSVWKTVANNDLSNVSYPEISKGSSTYASADVVQEMYMSSDGKTWYRKWKSGWKECGGFSKTALSSYKKTIVLPNITFSNTDYTIVITPENTGTGEDNYSWWLENNTTNSQFEVRMRVNISSIRYYCCGY